MTDYGPQPEAHGPIWPLLGDLSQVPADYIRDVAGTKRFLECWTMDPKFRDSFHEDPAAALRSIGVSLTREQVIPLVDREAATACTRALAEARYDDCPQSVVRYRAFIAEKVAHRGLIRERCSPTDERMAAWRARQVNRCRGELGYARSDAIIHAPAAFEISKGCTVGCWFCGVAAPKFDNTWPYTAENAEFWRGTLAALRAEIGPSAQEGFLYWATDPLDNPDYEHFITDFYEVLGRCPQTTTAMGQKDTQRTRRLLELSQSLGSVIDRFSIIALNSLYRIHEEFTAEELLRVECVPQNKEASEGHLKSNAGRARKFAKKRSAELVPDDQSSTIACVSGFLFNMIDRSVQLITPCDANDRWPLGYWVLERGTFAGAGELRALVRSMIDRHMKTELALDDRIRLRPDARLEVSGDELRVVSSGLSVAFGGVVDPGALVTIIGDGLCSVEEIALHRYYRSDVALAESIWLLEQIFRQGFFDEEPSGEHAAVWAADLAGLGSR